VNHYFSYPLKLFFYENKFTLKLQNHHQIAERIPNQSQNLQSQNL